MEPPPESTPVSPEMVAILDDLRFCPVCGWRLREVPGNIYARQCLNHGVIFTVVHIHNGWTVEVDLAVG